MHLSEILKTELAKLRDRMRAEGGATTADTVELDIVETGTIRNPGDAYRVNDGWSTLTFAEEVAEQGGTLTAIDLDVSAAEGVLSARGLLEGVTFFEGHSIDILPGMLANAYARAKKANDGHVFLGGDGFVDVAFLDSDNDAALILHEYLIVKRMVRSPGLIMVDDVDVDSTGVVKGHQIVPWLEREGTPYRTEMRHGDGYRTGVLIIEV
jgi:predicted O-methyltransferase YrrM